MTLGGTVAVLGLRIWTAANANHNTPKTTRRAMMRGFPHSYVEPPHSNANKRLTTLGMKKKVPSGSSRTNCCQMVAGCPFVGGTLSKNTKQTVATAPIGRLI